MCCDLQGPRRWVPPNEVASIFYEEQVILFSQIKTSEEAVEEEEENGQIWGEEKAERDLPLLPLPPIYPSFPRFLRPLPACFTSLLSLSQNHPPSSSFSSPSITTTYPI